MVDVKTKLSALWVTHMLSTTYADVLRLYDPGEAAAQMIEEWLLVSAITMVIPIFMVFLSLTLKYKANRWANMSIGIFFIGYDLLFLISSFSIASPAYEIFLGIVYVVFAALIVWHAWKWPKQEG